jgi:nucleotide-binding universal stress UspA family protein
MTFLVTAKVVTILLVDPDISHHRLSDEPGADIALQLARHGAQVNVDRVASNGSSVAQAILSYAINSRSDLLVFGAYSQGRVKERLLGGTTRSMRLVPTPRLTKATTLASPAR